ncbi:MAG: GNAT family N-acetyltransferase [Actinocatenispora sp.]
MDIAVRHAEESDLDALAAYEVTIAEISFGDDAVADPAIHRKKLAKALDRDREGMLVATAAPADADGGGTDGSGESVVGWLWLAVNTNFLTGQRYANFRSLAVSEGPGSDRVGELLLDRALAYARAEQLTEIVGKVHVGNESMRVLYRKYGFSPAALTMKRRLTVDS